MSFYVVASRFPFTGNKGPSPNHEKQPQTIFTPPQNLQLALCIRAGRVLLASAKPRFVRRTARWGSIIHHFRECVSTAPESASFTPLQPTLSIAHGDLSLVCGCSAHLLQHPMNSYCANNASRGSLDPGSECSPWAVWTWVVSVLQRQFGPG
jgi:hypothetical protein